MALGRLGLAMVSVRSTHPCRSRLDGRKSDRTLGGGWWQGTVTAPLEVAGVDGRRNRYRTLGGGRWKGSSRTVASAVRDVEDVDGGEECAWGLLEGVGGDGGEE